jgi:hypothetical protein
MEGGNAMELCSETMNIKEYFSMGLALLVIVTFILTVASTGYEILERYMSK